MLSHCERYASIKLGLYSDRRCKCNKTAKKLDDVKLNSEIILVANGISCPVLDLFKGLI